LQVGAIRYGVQHEANDAWESLLLCQPREARNKEGGEQIPRNLVDIKVPPGPPI
jgi:hypothetical protein